MFKKFTRKLIKGLARAETPYVYLGKDQHLCYRYNDIFRREMIFSEHTPYKVLRQQNRREGGRIYYRLFATDALHEHYLNLEGSIEIPRTCESEGSTRISLHEEIRTEGDRIISDHREWEAPNFSDTVEFSTLHMNKKYPSLTVHLYNLVPGGSIKVRKTTDKSRRGKREVTWDYDITLRGQKYSGHDTFLHSRKNFAAFGTIDPANIPMLEGDTEECVDFSSNSNGLGTFSLDLEMAPVCSPYLNITMEYENAGSYHLFSSLVSYLEDFTVKSEVSSDNLSCSGRSGSYRSIKGMSIRSGDRILCQSCMRIEDQEDVTVRNLKDVQEKNRAPDKYFRDQEYQLMFKSGEKATIRSLMDCDLQRKRKATSRIDDLLDAKFTQ